MTYSRKYIFRQKFAFLYLDYPPLQRYVLWSSSVAWDSFVALCCWFLLLHNPSNQRRPFQVLNSNSQIYHSKPNCTSRLVNRKYWYATLLDRLESCSMHSMLLLTLKTLPPSLLKMAIFMFAAIINLLKKIINLLWDHRLKLILPQIKKITHLNPNFIKPKQFLLKICQTPLTLALTNPNIKTNQKRQNKWQTLANHPAYHLGSHLGDQTRQIPNLRILLQKLMKTKGKNRKKMTKNQRKNRVKTRQFFRMEDTTWRPYFKTSMTTIQMKNQRLFSMMMRKMMKIATKMMRSSTKMKIHLKKRKNPRKKWR